MRDIDPIPERFPSANQLISYDQFLREGCSAADRERHQALREESAVRNVADSVVHPSVKAVLVDAGELLDGFDYAVIGGIALGSYAQPRYTEDVDIILATDKVAEAKRRLSAKFKAISDNRMEHRNTGAIIELVNPGWVDDVDDAIAISAINDAVPHMVRGRRVPVASARHLIALKLSRAKRGGSKGRIDQADIMAVIKAHGRQDMSDIPLSDELRKLYDDLADEAEKEKEREG